jgi:uncharacterized protein YggE
MQLENAQRENAQNMTRVIESLTRHGVQGEEIRTQVYQIQPRYEYLNNEQVFIGLDTV